MNEIIAKQQLRERYHVRPEIVQRYRGILWFPYAWHNVGGVVMGGMLSPTLVWVCDYVNSDGLPFWEVVRTRVSRAINCASFRCYRSFDDVPWEVHAIDDEDVYQIVLTAYLANAA